MNTSRLPQIGVNTLHFHYHCSVLWAWLINTEIPGDSPYVCVPLVCLITITQVMLKHFMTIIGLRHQLRQLYDSAFQYFTDRFV